MKCDLELYIDLEQKGKFKWVNVATLELASEKSLDEGYRGACRFNYEADFSTEPNAIGRTDYFAVSCRFPVNYELYSCPHWPAFVLDILPTGAGRRTLLSQLHLKDGAKADWKLLLQGAGNPPGNLRIAQAAKQLELEKNQGHPGFIHEDIIRKEERFIEYAFQHGAPVAGSTGAQGDAPKFLLTEDAHGKWHADGALPDEKAARHWLVKFPRGKLKSDISILKNEAAYFYVAKEMGLHVGSPPILNHHALFIPRFDRKIIGKQVYRLGMESLCSLAGVSDFGVSIPQLTLCQVIAKYSSTPEPDIIEFILRDVLNVAMGNTDNHPRNSAMLKLPDGTVKLSPLFDFAPMFLDDQMIPRNCRWENADDFGSPNWSKVLRTLEENQIPVLGLKRKFKIWRKKLKELPKILGQCGVEPELIQRLEPKIEQTQVEIARACEKT